MDIEFDFCFVVFNFIGEQDVAQVTGEAFEGCNSTNAVIIGTSSPTNFTITSLGEYYFISTIDTRCDLGQKLAINATTSPPPPPPRGPATYIVGDEIGWIVPPGGAIAYSVWANFNKTFIVGDTLVFNFANETSDVVVVSQSSYETCDTTNSSTVLTRSPARYTLARTGGHYFTSTYPRRCVLGQRLAINVTGDPASTLPPSSGPTITTPSSNSPVNSVPLRGGAAIILVLMSMGVAFLA
jgi:hypothetical protein